MTVFNSMRVLLWDTSEKGVKAREEMKTIIAIGKAGCGVTIAGSVALVALGVFAMLNYPVTGCLVALTGAFFGIYARDGLVISENLEKIITKSFDAAMASISEEKMAADLLDNTWTARVFTSMLVVGLKAKDK